MDLLTTIALAAVALFFLGIIGIAIAQKMSLRVDISVPDHGYNPGDKVTGSVKITAKRAVKLSQAFVVLRCHDTQHKDNGHPTTEIYRQTYGLQTPAEMRRGESFTAGFVLEIPAHLSAPGLGLTLPAAVNSLLAPLAQTALRRRKMDINWQVGVDIKASGLDISEGARLDVDLMPS